MTANAAAATSHRLPANASKLSKLRMRVSDFRVVKSDFVSSRESICAGTRQFELLQLKLKKNKKTCITKQEASADAGSQEKIQRNLKSESDLLVNSEFVQPLVA